MVLLLQNIKLFGFSNISILRVADDGYTRNFVWYLRFYYYGRYAIYISITSVSVMFYRYQKGYLEAVILGKNKQYNGKGKRKKDKPSLTKHYTEVLWKVSQFLLHYFQPSCNIS
jgi:hypothetical protein